MTQALEWATAEFGGALLGDARRTRRLVLVAAALAERPDGMVTAVMQTLAEREGAFRFVENEAVSVEAIAASIHRATAARLNGRDCVVAVDQSTLTLTDRVGKPGFGRTGTHADRGRGFQVMTALAIDADGATAGIVGQAWWARQEKSPAPKKDKRPAEQRESILWRQALLQAEQVLATSNYEGRAWYQLDRGADSGAVLELASDRKLRITVRSAHDRSLIDDERLRSRLSAAPTLGSYTLKLSKTAKREARTARLGLRAAPVTVCINDAKGRLLRTVSLFAVHVREQAKPNHGARLEWWLLTTVPTATFEEAKLVVTHYTKRWRVEEFHRAWKSGVCNIERSQLRSDDAFKRWATISATVAARAERLKAVSRAEPERPATDEFSRDEIDAAILLSPGAGHRRGDVLTVAEAVLLVANLGGYTGKSSGGPPGVRVIQRGLDQIVPAGRALAALRRSG